MQSTNQSTLYQNLLTMVTKSLTDRMGYPGFCQRMAKDVFSHREITYTYTEHYSRSIYSNGYYRSVQDTRQRTSIVSAEHRSFDEAVSGCIDCLRQCETDMPAKMFAKICSIMMRERPKHNLSSVTRKQVRRWCTRSTNTEAVRSFIAALRIVMSTMHAKWSFNRKVIKKHNRANRTDGPKVKDMTPEQHLVHFKETLQPVISEPETALAAIAFHMQTFPLCDHREPGECGCKNPAVHSQCFVAMQAIQIRTADAKGPVAITIRGHLATSYTGSTKISPRTVERCIMLLTDPPADTDHLLLSVLRDLALEFLNRGRAAAGTVRTLLDAAETDWSELEAMFGCDICGGICYLAQGDARFPGDVAEAVAARYTTPLNTSYAAMMQLTEAISSSKLCSASLYTIGQQHRMHVVYCQNETEHHLVVPIHAEVHASFLLRPRAADRTVTNEDVLRFNKGWRPRAPALLANAVKCMGDADALTVHRQITTIDHQRVEEVNQHAGCTLGLAASKIMMTEAMGAFGLRDDIVTEANEARATVNATAHTHFYDFQNGPQRNVTAKRLREVGLSSVIR